MFIIPVTCTDSPFITQIGIEEGNFSLDNGLRCLVQFMNAGGTMIDKRLFVFEGQDFQNWANDITTNIQSLITMILAWANCTPS